MDAWAPMDMIASETIKLTGSEMKTLKFPLMIQPKEKAFYLYIFLCMSI